MGTPCLLFLGFGLGGGKAGGAGLGEAVIAALIERQLAVLEVQDRADSAVEKTRIEKRLMLAQAKLAAVTGQVAA